MNALFAWPGGKRNLIGTILPRIPAHTLYVEVFAGSAKLLFAKEPSRSEVLNDLNGDLANFYRVAKHRAAELAEALEHELVHPERFRELRSATPSDELDRALRFVFLTWYSYGAKGQHFAAGNLAELLQGRSRRSLDTIRDSLALAAERLKRVRIEQRDFAELVKRFDSAETFFYLDPPYVHYQENGRYDALSAERREELFEILSNAKGNFLMSFDDCKEVRELAREYNMRTEEVTTRYGLGKTKASRKPVTELLVWPSREKLPLATSNCLYARSGARRGSSAAHAAN